MRGIDQLTSAALRLRTITIVVSVALFLACAPLAHAQQSGSSGDDATADTSDAPATYTVQDDDTLYNISRRFGTSVRQLMRWNDLDSPDIKIGQTLQVRPPDRPDSDNASASGSARDGSEASEAASNASRRDETGNRSEQRPSSNAENESPRRASAGNARPRNRSPRTAPARRTPPGTVQAQSNDTFVDLAIRHGTTADTLFALNDSLRAPLPPGRLIQLPDRYGPPTHVVKDGDTMYSIAGEYGVSVRALRDANNLSDASIQPGQKLRVPNRDPSSAETSSTPRPDTTGAVALYPAAFSGRLTASGTTYDPDTFVGSHPSLPYGSVVLLSHPSTRNHCFVEIIDRGPLEDNVLMDVSDAVVRQLGMRPGARTSLELRVIWVER